VIGTVNQDKGIKFWFWYRETSASFCW